MADGPVVKSADEVKLIVFACEAGMGSSLMGAKQLQKMVKKAKLDIEVVHSPVNQINPDADVIVTHKSLADNAKSQFPDSAIVTFMLFFGDPEASPSTQHMVVGNGNMLYEGFMYFRTAVLKINGEGNGEASSYLGAVARQIRFGGNGELVMGYDPTDPDVPIIAGGSTVAMVE